MSRSFARALRLLPALGLLAVAAPAAAQEPVTSDNVQFKANVPYPLRWDSTTMEGTDIEFATITVLTPAPATPAAAPPTPAKPAKRSKKRATCKKKARKIKNKRKRARAIKRCKRKRKRARRSVADVDAATPGVQRTFAFAGSYVNGLQIIDVSDPASPKLAASYDCGISQADTQVFYREDLKRWLVTFTSDDGYSFQPDSACFQEAIAKGYTPDEADGDGTFIIDVTNPEKPFTVSFVEFDKGSHNMTVHPSGRYLYNSNSDLATDIDPGIEVADITDPAQPKQVAVLPITPMPGLGSDSHDIWFNADGTRAYSAAVSQTLIIDTTDPADPQLISSIWDPTVNVSHQAETVEADIPGLGKRTVLIVADEFAGATPTGQCPNGGLHLYDASPDVESAPVKLGYFNITEVRPTENGTGTCTAHVYQIDRRTNLMTIAWYNAGFRVLDLTSVFGVGLGAEGSGIVEVASGYFPEGSAWSAKSPATNRDKPFAVYTNDQERGFDAWQVDLSGGDAYRRTIGRFYAPGSEPRPAQGPRLRLVCDL